MCFRIDCCFSNIVILNIFFISRKHIHAAAFRDYLASHSCINSLHGNSCEQQRCRVVTIFGWMGCISKLLLFLVSVTKISDHDFPAVVETLGGTLGGEEGGGGEGERGLLGSS